MVAFHYAFFFHLMAIENKKLSRKDPEIFLQESGSHRSIWQCASEAENEHTLWL